MKFKLIITFLSFLVVGTLVSCLDGDPMNTPPGAQSPFLIMTNNAAGFANNPVSGLRYFGNQALTYPSSHTKDSITFFVALEGTAAASKDVNVTLTMPEEALDDYYATDSIVYVMMPDSVFDLANTTGVIRAGEAYAEFKVFFYPSKFDPAANYMLPIAPTNNANIKLSSNYGSLYYHTIGNPIAATYVWTYRRYNSADSSAVLSVTPSTALFGPKNPTTVETVGGYAATVGITAPYVISFKNNGGNLSNFKVTIDPDLPGGLTANGIALVQPPTFLKIDVSPTYRHFKIWYRVVNSSGATRTLIDEYWWNQ